jgi:hypothetical protein
MAESINPDDLSDAEFAAYEVSEIAGAGHLVLTLTKANDWTGAIDAIRKDAKLAQRVANRLEELDFLIEELDDNTDIMAAQRKTPKVSVAICTVCNATASYASSALPDKCHMTLGCTGLWKKPANYTIKSKPDEGRVTTI